MKKQLSIIIIFMMGLLSFESSARNGELYESEYGYILRDINYLQYFSDEEYMDAYISYNATPQQPFVVLIHGGGFTNGSKRQMEELAMELLRNNISSVSVNYALLSKKYFKDNNKTTYQTMIHNIWNAIQHIQFKADEWNVRSNGYVLVGEEAGGYLALLSGYNFHIAVESIVAIGAITDMRDIAAFKNLAERKGQEKIIFTKLVGGEPYRTSKFLSNTYVNASPIDQARDVPTLLIHGVRDNKIPYSQSAKLFTFLNNNDVLTKIYSIENGSSSLLSDPAHKETVFGYITQWLTYKK